MAHNFAFRRNRWASVLLALTGTVAATLVHGQAGQAPAATVPAAAVSAAKPAAAESAVAPASAPARAASAALPSVSAPGKDIVLDSPALPGGGVSPSAGAIVPTPAATASAASAASPAPRYNSVTHDNATAGALAELGLDLMRQRSAATGNAQANAVVSPLSLASALGMVHAGTTGAGARELATLLGTTAAGERIYTTRLPGLFDRLAKPGEAGSPFVMANRVWVDESVVHTIPATYASTLTKRYRADAAVLPFAQAPAARKAINDWVSQKTASLIPELMPEGSVSSTTKVVVTNAIHFKSKWALPFDPAKTAAKPFHTGVGDTSKPVPTMSDERQVRMGTVDNATVIELPFAGNEFSLMVAMPPVGHTLNAFETDLEGLDIASWSAQLKPVTCRLQLPKFSIAPASQSLKVSLQVLGVKTVFGNDADFSPMLGKAGKGVYLDNVYQSATIIIDEAGGEAAAATGAAVMAKSFAMPAPACAVDRPFIFAVMHNASGTPLFVGKISDPTQK